MPYLISANYSEYDHDSGNDRCNDKYNDNAATSEELMIENAMKTISFLSCIKFIKWDGKRKDYIHFHPHKKRLG